MLKDQPKSDLAKSGIIRTNGCTTKVLTSYVCLSRWCLLLWKETATTIKDAEKVQKAPDQKYKFRAITTWATIEDTCSQTMAEFC